MFFCQWGYNKHKKYGKISKKYMKNEDPKYFFLKKAHLINSTCLINRLGRVDPYIYCLLIK